MHRSNRGVRVGTLALQLLLLLGAGNVACRNDGSGTSTNVIDASAGDGNSTDGAGGRGGATDFWIDYGGAGSIEVTSSGSVDASFTPTESFAPELVSGLVWGERIRQRNEVDAERELLIERRARLMSLLSRLELRSPYRDRTQFVTPGVRF